MGGLKSNKNLFLCHCLEDRKRGEYFEGKVP